MTATVVVAAGTIEAIDDDFSASPINSVNGGTAGNVINNDTLNGTPVSISDISIAIVSDGGITGVTKIGIPSGVLVILKSLKNGMKQMYLKLLSILHGVHLFL